MFRNLFLKWNSHNSAVTGFFSSLHEKHRFSDATIACNGKLYPVHQVVLSACSNHFKAIFEGFADSCKNPLYHPIIILNDISNTMLEVLLHYMYLGEVTVEQQNLTELVKTARALQVKGLSDMDKNSSQDITLNNLPNEASNGERSTSNWMRVEPDNEAVSISNGDPCRDTISSKYNLNGLSISEVAQNKSNDEELLSKKAFGEQHRRLESVGQKVDGLEGLHEDCDSGSVPPATVPPATVPPAPELPPSDATVLTSKIKQIFCSSLPDPAFSIKLEPGVEEMQTLDCRKPAPPQAKVAQGTEVSALLDSFKNSSQLPMDTNLGSLPHSLDSSCMNLGSGAQMGELFRASHSTPGNATYSCSVHGIPEKQRKTEVDDEESSRLASDEVSSCTSPASMPVISDCYSLIQSETSSLQVAGFSRTDWRPQPGESSLKNSGPCLSKFSSSNLNTNSDIIPSNIDHDDEFQALKWSVPSLKVDQSGRGDHENESSARGRRVRIFRCSHCSYQTCCQRYFLHHRRSQCPHRPREHRKQHPVIYKKFGCHLCEHTASNTTNLKAHLLMHDSKKTLTCPLCSYSTDKDHYLQTHLTRDHRSQSNSDTKLLHTESFEKCEVDDDEETQTSFQCEDCLCSFQKMNCLLEHKRLHSELDTVKCPDCDYRTVFHFNMKKHTGILSRGSYKCDFCSYTACTGNLIAIHSKLDRFKYSPRIWDD